MIPEQVEEILKALRQKMSDEEDDAVFYALRDASKAIRAWQADGRAEDIPYQTELRQWGLLPFVVDETSLSAEEDAPEEVEAIAAIEQSVAAEAAPDELTWVAPTITDDLPDLSSDVGLTELIEEKEEEVAADPDDGLQEVYDDALALLANGRYHAARQALLTLQEKSIGRLQTAVALSYEEAQNKLVEQVRTRREKAESHAEKQPNDFKGQRRLWDQVLEVDPDDEGARQALRQIDEREQAQKVAMEIEQLGQEADGALTALRLMEMNRTLGRAESLQQNNTLPHLQSALDDLVQQISRQREQLRSQLGSASTLAVSGNQREAYRQAKEYVDKGVVAIFDQAGILGEVGEVDSYLFYQEARKRFIASLRDLAQQRLNLVDTQKEQNPAQAFKTLQDARQLLRDDILNKEDRDELQPTLKLVEQAIQEVEERLQRFEKARVKVLEADAPGQPADAKYRLYREAQELYPDYPNIATYIESAQDALAAIAAGQLQDEIIAALRRKEQDDFEGALMLLQAARRHALQQGFQPKPGSSLSQALQEVTRREEEIAAGERDYLNMMATLTEVDRLLAQHEQEKTGGALAAARARLEQLTELELRHPQTQERRSRLIELQGVGESWEQGQTAYHLGEWENAIQLLTRVAASDAQEKNEAVRLMNRAKAVKLTLDARQAEVERRWGEALTRYRAAGSLFGNFNSDEYTERFQQEAQNALAQLKSLETNDADVQIALKQAQGWLTQGEATADKRVTPLEKVEPIPEFMQAVVTLQAVRDRQSTLKDEVETTLSQARKAWQKAYRQGMQAASQSDDFSILQQAVALGKQLNDYSLLYTNEDKQLWRSVQEKYLDVELIQLRRNPATKPAHIEENRRQRLDIAITPTDDLKAQYQEAMEQRVRYQIGEERQKGVAAAVAYLKKETSRPELYDNLGLFEELMHLLWETSEWVEAQMRAGGLAYRKLEQAKVISDLWQGFTTAAQLLTDGHLELFRAEMSRLYQLAQQGSDFQLLWERQNVKLVDWRVDWLKDQARQKSQSGSEEDVVAAAQLYAEAYRLRKNDNWIETGLRLIGQQLAPILAIRCQEAVNLTVRQSLEQSLSQVNRLYLFLSDIQSVADPLKLNQEMKEALKEALDHLDNKRRPWAQLQAQLEAWEKEKTAVLTDPTPFRGGAEGGWLLQPLTQKLNDARRLVHNNDREIGQLLTAKQQELQRLSMHAEELNTEVGSLHQALAEEKFSDVLTAVSHLERLWPPAQAEGFSGLEQIGRYADAFTQKEYRRLDEHKKRAQEQQNNLEQWANWSTQVKTAYDKVRKAAGPLKKPLDDLCHEKSLAAIAADCREVLKLCEAFQETLDSPPEHDPFSQRAMNEQAKVNAGWEDEVLDARSGYRGQATALLDQIDQAVKKLQSPLQKLRSAMQQVERVATPTKGLFGRMQDPDPALVQRWLRQAEDKLKECLRLDPLHDDVQKYKKRIEGLEAKYGGGQL